MPGFNETPPSAQPEDIAAEWERKLAAEGLGEVGEDKGKTALEESMGRERGGDAATQRIESALREYFLYRKGDVHGQHRYIADEIAQQAKVKAEDVDPAVVESIREEMLQRGTELGNIIQDLKSANPRLGRNDRLLARKAAEAYLANHPGEDPAIVEEHASMQINPMA